MAFADSLGAGVGGGGFWAVARAARGQNAVGSCVHSAANYTHRGASWRRRETIWRTGRRRHSKGMSAAREAKKYTESEPNYICLYLLPGATAASQRPCMKGGEATACFVFLSVVVLQFNYRAPGSSCWGRGCIKIAAALKIQKGSSGRGGGRGRRDGE